MMKKSNCYIYYNALVRNIFKSRTIHIFLLFFENLCTIVLLFDITNFLFGTKVIGHFKILEQLYLNRYLNETWIICIFFAYFILIYVLYFFSNLLLSYHFFQSFFINYYEIFHLRILSFFFIFSLLTLNKIQLIFSYFLLLFYFVISIFHFLYFHLPIYSIEHIRFIYDSFSSFIDSVELIEKNLLIFGNTLGNKHKTISKYFFYISFSIYIFLGINLIYIMKKKSFLLMNNVVINKFRASMIFIKIFVCLVNLTFVNENLIKLRMKILYINFVLIIFVLFMFFYNPFEHIYFRTYGYLLENSYYYFFSIYDKHEKNKVLFYDKTNEFINKEFLNKDYTQDTLSLIHNFLCDNDYFQFIQLFLKEIKRSKINDLYKSRILMIRLILLINKYKKKNFIISMNLRSLFDLINLNNNLEQTYDVVNKLELTISFIDDSREILFHINDIIYKNYNVSINEFVQLSYLLNKICTKNYKNRLLKNKVNDSSYFSMICGIFYEEILNKPITKNGFQIRENIVLYEDCLNFLFENNNKITLTFDFTSEECRIIEIGKDLFHSFNTEFSLLFPEDFRDYQMILFKNGIFDLDYEILSQKRRSIHEKRQSNLFFLIKNYSTSRDVSFKFVVKKNKKGELGLLILDLKMLFNHSCKEYIVLNGYYLLGQNCLFTYKKRNNDVEKIYKLDFNYTNEENKAETLKNYLKKNQISQSKLKKLHSFLLNGFKYIIYSIEDKQLNQDTNILSFLKNTKNVNDTYLEKYNQKIEDSSSVAMSLLSGVSSKEGHFFSQHFKKLGVKKSFNHKQVYVLYIYQKLIFMIPIICLFLVILELVIKKKRKIILFHNYSILLRFRTLSKIYYHSIPSVMIAMCIAKQDEKNCVNFLNKYNKKFNERYPDVGLNFTVYFSRENYIKIDYFKNVSSIFYNEIYSLKDYRTDKFFEYEINYINILQNKGFFYLVNQTIEFKEAIKIFFNSMIILISDDYLTKPIYLLNVSTNPLSEIYFETKLEDYQLSYYTILANFNTYCEYFFKIHGEFNDVMNSKLNSYRNLNFIFLSLNFIIYNVFFIILILYLESYKIVCLEIFNLIKKRTNTEDFRVNFIKKIEYLTILLQIYSVNPTQIISSLEDLYSEFKKKQKEKNRLINPNQKIKEEGDYNITLFKNSDVRKSKINLLYMNLFIIIFSIITMFHLILLLIYILYFKKYKSVFFLIQKSVVAENTGYRDFIFYVNKIYNNFTENLMMSWLNKTILQETSDIIYTLYLITRERQELGSLFLPLSSYFTIDCNDFYKKIEDDLIDNYHYLYHEENIYQNLSNFCYENSIMDYNDQYKINTEQFSFIKKGLIQSYYYSMDEVIKTLNEYEFFRSGLFCLLIYRPLRTAENKFVYLNALEKMQKYMKFINYFDAFFCLFLLILILFICLFFFIRKIDKFLKEIARMKDVFIIGRFDNLK